MSFAAYAGGQVAIALFPILMMGAGAVDVMTMRIPNRLIVALATLFVPFAVVTGMPFWLMGLHAGTGAVLLLVGFGLFSLGWIGGGDAKLLAAAGLWLGFPCVLPFILFSAVAGGLLAAAVGIWFTLTAEASLNSATLGNALAPMRPDLPYGFALATGAILAVPFSWWMSAASIPA